MILYFYRFYNYIIYIYIKKNHDCVYYMHNSYLLTYTENTYNMLQSNNI